MFAMVFSELRDSFNSVTKKVTEKVTGSVVNPLNAVKDSMTKSVIGPRLDLFDQVRDNFKKIAMQKSYAREIKKMAERAKKQKFPAAKMKQTMQVLSAIDSHIFLYKTYEEAKKRLTDTLDVFKKEIEAGRYVTALKDTALQLGKSNKLAKLEKQVLVVEFQEMQVAVQNTIRKLDDDLTKVYMLPKRQSFSYENSYETNKTSLKKNYTTAIDNEFLLIRAWRELTSTVYTLQKHVRTITKLRQQEGRSFGPERTSVTVLIKKETKQIDAIIKNKIQTQIKAIEKLEKEITDNNKLLLKSVDDSMTAIKTQLQSLKTGIAETDTALQNEVRALVKEIKTNRTSYTQLFKKESTVHTALLKAIKEPYDTPSLLRKAFDAEAMHHNIVQDSEIQFETYKFSLYVGMTALLNTYRDIGAFAQVSQYHKLEFYREQALQFQLINRVKHRHVTQIKTVWDKLLELKPTHPAAFTALIRTIEKKSNDYAKSVTQNETIVNDAKKKIDTVKKTIRDVVAYEKVLRQYERYFAEYTEQQLFTSYSEFLGNELKGDSALKAELEKKLKKIDLLLKKGKVELEDKEQSVKTVKKTTSLSMDVKHLRNKHHTKELFYETAVHFVDTLADHTKELQELQKAYAAQAKAAGKECQTLQKKIKDDHKSLKSSPLSQDISLPDLLAHTALKQL